VYSSKKLNLNDLTLLLGPQRGGTCKIADNGNSLIIDATNNEMDCIVGANFGPGSTLSFNVEFSSPRNGNVGRHGGI
jgi:hypothetical protein